MEAHYSMRTHWRCLGDTADGAVLADRLLLSAENQDSLREVEKCFYEPHFFKKGAIGYDRTRSKIMADGVVEETAASSRMRIVCFRRYLFSSGGAGHSR